VLKERIFALSAGRFTVPMHACDDARAYARANLDHVLRVFVAGYNVALGGADDASVADRLTDTYAPHHVGFAFEGAGMCHALFDLLVPGRTSRLRAFTDGAARGHDYIATVGAGFAVARVPWGRALLHHYLRALDPAVAWCVLDGYGFHQGFFHPEWFTLEQREAPASFRPYARRLFDCGVGRSFWWTQAGFGRGIKRAIERFPVARRADMWCGIGMAAAYAGGVATSELGDLLVQAGRWSKDFLAGFPLAARMRQKGGNRSPWTEMACAQLLSMSAETAADMVRESVTTIAAELTQREGEMRETGYARVRERITRALQQDRERAGPATGLDWGPAPGISSRGIMLEH
jgi:hypothetical protein